MFESFKFNPEPKKQDKEIMLNYAEIIKNKKAIEERKLKEQTAEGLKDLAKQIEIQEGVEKARKNLEKEFEHRA